MIVLTCSVWIFTKNNERKDGLIKKRYGLVSTQNAIFKIFIAWINAVNIKSNEYDNKNHIHITYFTKEELMSFIFNFSEEYLKEFELSIGLSQLELGNEVDKKYQDELKLRNLKPRKESVGLFFKKPGEIDIDLSQKIADAIIEKLLNKKMIFVTDLKSFSEIFRFDYKYL